MFPKKSAPILWAKTAKKTNKARFREARILTQYPCFNRSAPSIFRLITRSTNTASR